jgi:hypothetical protein
MGAAAQGGIIIAGTTVMVVIINEFLNPRRIHFLFSMVSERNTGQPSSIIFPSYYLNSIH